MSRTRAVFGVFMGLALVASGAAHSLLGWPQLGAGRAPAR